MTKDVKPWALVTSINDHANSNDLVAIVPQVTGLIDEWQAQGRVMWSGPFDNQVSSMAVFEATEEEAREFFRKYENICSNSLTCYLYQWDAMPLLSILSK